MPSRWPDKITKALLEPLSHLKVKYGLTPPQSHISYFSLEISPSLHLL
jgi:hypothetical protein